MNWSEVEMMLAAVSLRSLLAQKWVADIAQNLVFLFMGATVSFYATIVFERYKRFGDILRAIGQARSHSGIYPTSASDLVRAASKSTELWRFLESQQWELDAEGHHKAAAQVARLAAFVYRSNACISHMLNDQKDKKPINIYFIAFQSEYQTIYNDNFIQFEKPLRANRWALWRPKPSSILPTRQTAVVVDYFDKLL